MWRKIVKLLNKENFTSLKGKRVLFSFYAASRGERWKFSSFAVCSVRAERRRKKFPLRMICRVQHEAKVLLQASSKSRKGFANEFFAQFRSLRRRVHIPLKVVAVEKKRNQETEKLFSWVFFVVDFFHSLFTDPTLVFSSLLVYGRITFKEEKFIAVN